MMILFLIVFIVLLLVSPVFRRALFSWPKTISYGLYDFILYFFRKKWLLCPVGECIGFVGLFGKGKTLSMVHKAILRYRRYHGKKVFDTYRKKWVTQQIHIISNVDLSVPFEKLVSMQQMVLAANRRKAYDEEHNALTVTIVLVDEASVQLNCRDFKGNFNPYLLNTLLTARHNYISFYYSAQRFGHVDSLLRQVTDYVVDCDKVWRFQKNYCYDAWHMENATNVLLLKPFRKECWFIRNRDFKAYDTLACVDNLTKSWKEGNMLSEEEILSLQRNETMVGVDGVVKQSRRFKKVRKR
ncbi:MAG: hypothetical protein J1E35_03610 [Lachnospiraceae bacterium]|nr:hypothetical protein [Lachnospiraceae bacterium]